MTTTKQRKVARKVPEYLVKEILNGIPIHYKGYKAVLRKEKTLEDIMGASGLQSFIVSYIYKLMVRQLSDDMYHILTGETGLHLKLSDNLSGDIVLYDYDKLPISNIDTHYLSIPPKIDIEIDVNIDTTDFTEQTYIYAKTDRLLLWGVEKVIWVLSVSKKVIVAEQGKDWLIVDWSKDIEIIDGIKFNVSQYLERAGVTINSQ
ncbi:MAG: Uma2 family endonuclease [Arcicella sp.]|nr:Uma2 family endonuclease [Arcicella sp.]